MVANDRLVRLALFGLVVVGYSTEMEPYHGANFIWPLFGDAVVREPVEGASEAHIRIVPGAVTELHPGEVGVAIWTGEVGVFG